LNKQSDQSLKEIFKPDASGIEMQHYNRCKWDS